MRSFNEEYRELLSELKFNGVQEVNQRTGIKIKMLEGGYSFKLDLRDGLLPIAGNRRYWPHLAAAETAWQFMGTQDPSWILSKAPKIWQDFVEDGKLKTAYGYRWREHFGRDQLELAMEELHNNPTNRQLFISAWDPATDGLGGPQPKNIPCPLGFSLTRTHNLVHCSLFIRSSDVFVGLPYDVMGYSLTLAAVAHSVGCGPGTLHITLAHPHLYEPHFDHVTTCLANTHRWELEEPVMPRWTVDQIKYHPDTYVENVRDLEFPRHKWNPMPELVK